jgi:nucleotide-binding universal stress UspA family protein
MTYKTILVHADMGAAAPDRIRLAARLACTFDAHLVGSALTGISRFIPPRVIAEGGPALVERCAAMRRDAADALKRFSRVAAEEAVASVEARLIDDDIDGAMALHARYADLVLAGQTDHSVLTPGTSDDLPDYLFLHCGRPVLVVPRAACRLDLQGEALVAWDGSLEATRAITGALPLLRQAQCVTVLTFDGDRAWPSELTDPCSRMVGYLRRQGLKARIGRRPDTHHVAESLLAEAAAADAGLLVMGAYGHAHLREMLVGGVTASILRSMTLPVLFAH